MELSAYKDIPSPGPEKEEARLKFLEAEAKRNIYRKTLPSVLTAVVMGGVILIAASYLFDFIGKLTSAPRFSRAAVVPSVVYPRSIPVPSMAAPRVIAPREYMTQRPAKDGPQARLKENFVPASFVSEPPAAAQFKNLPKPKHWREYDLRCDPGLVGHDDCEPVQRSLIGSFKATDIK